MDNAILNKAADSIRVLSLSMVEKAKSGHPGGAMGGADYINLLYTEFLNFDPDDMTWPFRDRFFLDPGHMSAMLYSVLSLVGNYSSKDLQNFRQWGSVTPGHPELDVERGVENTSGPLGQGHTMAVGAAIAEKFLVQRFGDWMSHKIYTFISDGGIQEEISQGAGRIAGYLGLNNLVMFFDSNDIQLSTMVDEVTVEDTARKYKAWGWKVISIDGNDVDSLRGALMKSQEEQEKPVLIIGKTIMGKGALDKEGNSFEGQVSTHGQPLSNAGADVKKTILNLQGNPDAPFDVAPEITDLYQQVCDQKREMVKLKNQEFEDWKSANPSLAINLNNILTGKLPEIDFASIDVGSNVATRSASATILGEFAGRFRNMIVMSADLANSDKTDGFLKKTTPIVKNDFSGAFLHAGVSELTMASLANGMALHDIIPICGTFFVFSDYMKPAIRLAALMELPVKYVWTHDSFRVGEDGPTHQPVEQEAQIRLMEKLKNHKGQNSMLVLRPADAAETQVAYKMAIENNTTPTGLILSRQNIQDLPVPEGSSKYESALKATKGAYIVQEDSADPDLILVANGSEVSTLVEGVKLLKIGLSINTRVVSIISEGVFRNQDKTYCEKIIPSNKPVLGFTAGLPAAMSEIVGAKGRVFGMDHFGYSAPYTTLDAKFGFSAENVKKQVLIYLKDLK